MGQTTNIGLHQWAAEDPVLRTDFNADFAKIDRAVGAIPLTKLKEVVTTQDAQQLDVDVSDIDFDLYDEVIVYAELVNTKDDSNVSPYCAVRINGDSESNYGSTSGFLNSSLTMNSGYLLYPGIIHSGQYYATPTASIHLKRKGKCLSGWCLYAYMRQSREYYLTMSSGVYKLAAEDTPITQLNFTVSNISNNAFKAGCRLRFLGVKK